MVVNSNDSAATGCVSPISTSSSKPSTSILMKAGTPCSAISASSVVIGTRIDLVPDAGPASRGASCAASMKASEAVEMVGLSVLTISRDVAGVAADRLARSIVTSASRP